MSATDRSRPSAGPTRVAVAAPNAAATAAATRLAADGGNAVDAALASMLVACVNEIGIVSPGSGGFVTVCSGGRIVTVDGWCEMPGRGLPAEARGRGFWDIHTPYGGGTTMTVGHGSVGTPGTFKAFGLAHELFGRAPWHEVVAPAVETARDGFALSSTSEIYLDHVHELVFGWQPGSSAVVHNADGSIIRAGSRVVIPDLADSLQLIADEGPEVFYTGDLARLITADMAAHDGLVTAADLASYEAVVREPLRVSHAGWELATNPPPAIGGVVLTAILALLGDLPHDGPWTDSELRRLIDVEHAVLGRRLSSLDLEDERLAAGEELLRLAGDGDLARMTSPSTAAASVVDDDGDACAVTISSGYCSGVLSPGTGMWMNNALGEQELLPGGAHALPTGTRITSNMAPTVARRTADGAVLAIGSPGSDRIPTAIAQTYALFAHGGLTLAEAVPYPRVHVRVRDDVLVDHEADLALPPDLGLPTRSMPPHSMYFGGVAAAFCDPGRELVAVGDPRRAGAVAVSPE